jgi:AbrB family looped-hinge helix DNA binding protein
MSVQTTVGPRGRVTIPVALRQQAGINEGDLVVLRFVRPGVIVVETPQAIKDDIRSGVQPGEYDAVAEVRALRDHEEEG